MTMEYNWKERGEEVLRELNAQRMAGQFCDVMLTVGEDAKILAHRCVLSASSDYFRAMFLGDFDDRNAEVCHISACEYKALRSVISYLYTGKIRITMQNVNDVLQVADYLCIRQVKSFCSDLLRHHLDEDNCVQVKALADRFSLNEIREEVMKFLTPRMCAVLAKQNVLELPFDYIYPLLDDKQLNYVREADILGFVRRWIDKSPEERRAYTGKLIACVDFSYLGSEYIRRHVMNARELTDLLQPEQTKALHIKLSQQCYPARLDDMIACRSRQVKGTDEVKLLFYVIGEDRWYTLNNQPESHVLDGLESMACDNGALYLLSSRREDLCGYMHGPKESKILWRVSLDRGQWSQMSAPGGTTGHCRLVPHVRGLYVIDRTGIIQKLDKTTNTWVTYSAPGFDDCPNATMFLLPMSIDKYIYVLRGYSEGYSFDYSQLDFSLHRYDTERYTWTTLAHIDSSDVSMNKDERFHGYEATMSSLIFKDALGFNRMRYDIISGACASLEPEVTVPPFISEIWGSATYRDLVYFSARFNYERPVFMLYDHGKRRFKMVSQPPTHVSGLLCHVVVPRSFRDILLANSK